MGLFLSYDCVKPRQNLEGKHITQCAMTEVSRSSLRSTLGLSQGYGLQGVGGQPLPRLCGVLLFSAEKVTLSSFYPNQPLPATALRPWVFYGLLTSLKQSMSLPRQGQLGKGRDPKFVKLDSPRICTERLDSESPGSRIPGTFLLQSSTGLSCLWTGPAQATVTPEALSFTGRLDCGGRGP
nr:uncharacterized protein LOC104653204 [Saimiri boliviensis boliviensis]